MTVPGSRTAPARRTARAAAAALVTGLIVLGASACGPEDGQTDEAASSPSPAASSPSSSSSGSASAEPSAAPSDGSSDGTSDGASADYEHVCGDGALPGGLSAEQRDMLTLVDHYKDAMDDEDTARGKQQREELVRNGVAPAYLGTFRAWEQEHSADGIFRKPVGTSPQCWDVVAPPAIGGKKTIVLNYHWFEDNDARVVFQLDKVRDGGTVFLKVTDSPL
ncbi:hypothetical protein GTW43_06465 [Streptomyces sp. SID5785]|uniref:hypothetical protein n=1 Tax=Streptomyces sp. SID5785 TaxID=2690309 RepID=UPI001361A56D|nr:hypothetical protein [Streptomyces sp. SID5785]MZD04729.1 hypothetical protein [Streptomyces sp. SID5785]